MAAPPRRSSSTGSMQRRDSARQLAAQYTGAGKSFKVKCLGSEDVSDARGDVVAADCMKRLRQVNQELGRRGYLAQATITLQLKGLAVFDSRSKSVTLRAPIDQVTYACHDPEDTSVFAVIVRTEQQESFSGLRLHAFQAEQKTATAFVRSTRELFQLMYKMMKAKKRMSGQLEGSPLPSSPSQEGLYTHIEGVATSAVDGPPATGYTPSKDMAKQSDVNNWVFPAQSDAEEKTTEPSSSSKTSQQAIVEERRKSVMEEWKSLDIELKRIAQELGMDEEEAATPSPVPQQKTKSDTRPTPFDDACAYSSPANTSDPFADDFFQKSFDSPSKFVAAVQQGASPQLSRFRSPALNPTASAGFVDRNSSPVDPFSSTPDGQFQAAVAPASALQHRSSRQEISLSLNPFQSSHGMIDPFQSEINAAYDSFSVQSASTTSSLDLANPLYGSHDSSMFPGYQSPFSEANYPALVTSFSPNISGPEMHPIATSSQNTSQNHMAGNPFATDFQTPPHFSATGRTPDPFQSSHALPSLSMSPSNIQPRSSISGNDPFADLIPLALEAVERPESRQTSEKKSSKQPMVPPDPTPSWDTFEESHAAPETAQPLITPESVRQNETGTGFESSLKDASREQGMMSPLSAFEESFPMKNTNAAANGFDDSFHETRHEGNVFSDFDRAFEIKPAEATVDSRSSSKASFEDHFSPVAAGQMQAGQPPRVTDTHGFGDDFTNSLPSASWISF